MNTTQTSAASKLAHRDMTGQVFGSFECVKFRGNVRKGPRWLMRCQACGHQRTLIIRLVKSGRTDMTCPRQHAEPLARPVPPLWPFPRVDGRDGLPVSPVWRAACIAQTMRRRHTDREPVLE